MQVSTLFISILKLCNSELQWITDIGVNIEWDKNRARILVYYHRLSFQALSGVEHLSDSLYISTAYTGDRSAQALVHESGELLNNSSHCSLKVSDTDFPVVHWLLRLFFRRQCILSLRDSFVCSQPLLSFSHAACRTHTDKGLPPACYVKHEQDPWLNCRSWSNKSPDQRTEQDGTRGADPASTPTEREELGPAGSKATHLPGPQRARSVGVTARVSWHTSLPSKHSLGFLQNIPRVPSKHS